MNKKKKQIFCSESVLSRARNARIFGKDAVGGSSRGLSIHLYVQGPWLCMARTCADESTSRLSWIHQCEIAPYPITKPHDEKFARPLLNWTFFTQGIKARHLLFIKKSTLCKKPPQWRKRLSHLES